MHHRWESLLLILCSSASIVTALNYFHDDHPFQADVAAEHQELFQAPSSSLILTSDDLAKPQTYFNGSAFELTKIY